MQLAGKESAISELVGTMLLMSIVVGVFGLLYIGVMDYDFHEESPLVHIVASIEGPNIVFEHRGGPDVGIHGKIIITIGGNETQVTISDYLNTTAKQNGLWNIGEQVVYPVGDIAFMQVKATVIDEHNDYVLLTGILQEGEVNDLIIVTLDATDITPNSVTLHMNYNFRNRTGDLRFAYKEYNGGWNYTTWIHGQSGSGFYNETINGLTTTLYYYQAELQYCLNISTGENKSFIYTGTELNTITPYSIAATPLLVTAQGSDLLDSVSLWYQYSPDNITWSTNWWDTEWGARRPINLFVSAGSTPSDCQVLLNISYEPQMNMDFGDLRFIDYQDNITEYPYWIENKTDGERAYVWIRLDQSLVPQNHTILWMYYYNPSVTTTSDGEITFYFFDTFEGIVLDVDWQPNAVDYAVTANTLRIGQGTISTLFPLTVNLNDGYVLESRVKYHETTGNTSGSLTASSDQFPEINNNGIDALCCLHRPLGTTDMQRLIARGSSSGFDCGSSTIDTLNNNEWYILSQHFHVGGVNLQINRSIDLPFGCGWIKNLRYIVLGAYQSVASYNIQDTSYDWVLVRRYMNVEPEQYIGDQEFVGWHQWKDGTNPDTTHPWTWNFNFPEGAGYYEFYSIGHYASIEENHPTTADTHCYFYPTNPPTVVTVDSNTFLIFTELIMSYDFKDFNYGYIAFAYKRNVEPNWHYTFPVGRSGSGTYSKVIHTPALFNLYRYKALLLYDITLIEGAVKTFMPPFP
ncbi:MAG: DUF2341 domain-containing protein [Candidatus Thermoplasmatota archaeon]|nr:DUF2341 domain-containing protein [Candidatus Thermoplasmatota archaeon]MBU1940705.1 DUF2341 domain-containing protein [Candidatus Thermoplasmatota archaeon]